MKTKHHSRRGLSRLVAILLCALCVIGLFPMSAFALEPGTKASSWMGDQYLASDGDTYGKASHCQHHRSYTSERAFFFVLRRKFCILQATAAVKKAGTG